MDESIPKETETIAVKRAARVREKIKRTRTRLKFSPAWWANKPLEGLVLSVLFLLNLYLISPIFGSEAFSTSYSGPIIPLFAKIISFLGVPLSYSTQLVIVSFFAFFPISLYLFIRRVGGRKLAAFLAILFVILPIYPFAFSRINSAFFGQDAPHIASLSLIPIALLAQIRFSRDGGFRNLILASLLVALVVLTSPFGFIILTIFVAITAFSEMLLGRGRLKLMRFTIIMVVAAGLTSFWYNPQFTLSLLFGEVGTEVRHTVTKLIPVSLFSIPILGAFGFLLFDRKPDLQPVFLASFYTIIFAIIVLVGGGFFPSHPSRYLPEFGVSLAFLLGVGMVRLSDYFKFSEKIKFVSQSKTLITNVVTLGLAAGLVVAVLLGRSRVSLQEREVLGFWTDIERGRIWLQREQFKGAPSLFGYSITGMTIITLGFLGVQSKTRVTREEGEARNQP